MELKAIVWKIQRNNEDDQDGPRALAHIQMMSSEQRPNYLVVPILKITPDDAISTDSDAPTREWDATSEISHRDAVTLSSQSSQHADDFPESFCTSEENLSSPHVAPMFEASGDVLVCEGLLDLQTTEFSKENLVNLRLLSEIYMPQY